MSTAAACLRGEYSVSYVVGTTICIVLLVQWAWWQITHPDEQQSRADRRERKLAARRRRAFEAQDEPEADGSRTLWPPRPGRNSIRRKKRRPDSGED